MTRHITSPMARQVLTVVAVTGLACALLPLGSNFVVSFGSQFMLWITLAVSWSLFSGNSGYASFGHGVFFGVGTYITAAVLRSTDMGFPVAMLAGGLAAGALALAVGLAVFSSSRFAGDLFGLVTLAMAFIVTTVVANVPALDGGTGVFIREHVAGSWIGEDTRHVYLVCTALAGLTALVALGASATRWGTALRSIRDDETVAQSLGVPTYRYKVATFAVSAALAGLAGAPQAVYLGYVETSSVFTLNIPLMVIMMTILGGTTRWYGPIVGAASVAILREALLDVGSPELAQIVTGLTLVVVIALMPRGLTGFLSRPRPLATTRAGTSP
ncbi:branched-chain amino acid ABC transporter permease (plasmid) [Embleya sp. NBC_00888]|uniref:branched-chain amino acid ABC transporter permease n=1 Tax=Embleya sp. NBC_00888 TaxID=2975960 RepID=UPI002F913117|nr:branched-chain amino acid ABC transporter permease [Embleya sp. NBC_00888]